MFFVWIILIALGLYVVADLLQKGANKIYRSDMDNRGINNGVGGLKYCGGNSNVVSDCSVSVEFADSGMFISYGSFAPIHIDSNIDYNTVSFKGMSETQIRQDVTLARIAVFGIFALGLKKSKRETNHFIVMNYIDKSDCVQNVVLDSGILTQSNLTALNEYLMIEKNKSNTLQ